MSLVILKQNFIITFRIIEMNFPRTNETPFRKKEFGQVCPTHCDVISTVLIDNNMIIAGE